jgi:hypothetical protein
MFDGFIVEHGVTHITFNMPQPSSGPNPGRNDGIVLCRCLFSPTNCVIRKRREQTRWREFPILPDP